MWVGGWLIRAKEERWGQRRFKGKHRRQGIKCCECSGRWKKGRGVRVKFLGDRDRGAGFWGGGGGE